MDDKGKIKQWTFAVLCWHKFWCKISENADIIYFILDISGQLEQFLTSTRTLNDPFNIMDW